ncbi:NADP-dependent malic enzyme [Nitrosococcus watsonii]|uniref:NADP-dependent malic enzyme n=1 Tax=Nitrosococcus watsoni (strain C-113) TaxID=105559 RepID=D8K6C4_NITWC|nr:NADP-dependent malic enzyme [Nitrosococcus watsonii]ADJ28451.1 Malate dehydrogenase (oxaloacetate-decarboxylating) (NADP(+)), Phosphate acetyltransferase [Nitrosococcus watsonii C-113]
MIFRDEALEYHRRGRAGKLEVIPSKPCLTQHDLALAYSPGVAEPCREIHRSPDDVYLYTGKGNLVAVVTNGTAILGLGSLGPLASKPVMEGKGVLFKRFADIDVFDIELNAPTAEEVIQACQLLEPTFGGINLEDIAAPDCFHIEERLRETLTIPVFHDDQHGTAIISGAALLNACELAGKRLEDIKLVMNGAGAASIACAKFYLTLGVDPDNLLLCDSKGVLYEGREDLMPGRPRYNEYKAQFIRPTRLRTLPEALTGADAFCGLSVANVVTPAMVRSMNDNPIIFALANPDPEITYPDALAARPDVIMATGRSDYPNQVNNVLGFPFIFRGALDVRARAINEAMKIAAAQALAALAKEGVPESVCRAYGMEKIEFGREYLIPKPFDPQVLLEVTTAVAKAAGESGVARTPISDFKVYREQLERRLGRSKEVMRQVINKAKRRSQLSTQHIESKTSPMEKPASPGPLRIAFPEGDDKRIMRAAARIVKEGIGKPVLFGKSDEIQALAKQLSVNLEGIDLLDSQTHPQREDLAQQFFAMRARKGVTLAEARRYMLRRHYYAPMLLLRGEVEAVVCGETYHYPDSIRPALQILPLAKGISHASGLYMLLFKNRLIFCADTTVNITPDAETLAEIALSAADTAHRFDIEPRVALLSFSNFGSVKHSLVDLVQAAVKILHRRRPDLVVDGEMQADTATNEDILSSTYPFSRLKEDANVLIFPDLTSGNIAYKLLVELGGAEAIGPILTGLSKPYHVLQRDASVDAIVNIAAIAAVQAQEIELSQQA